MNNLSSTDGRGPVGCVTNKEDCLTSFCHQRQQWHNFLINCHFFLWEGSFKLETEPSQLEQCSIWDMFQAAAELPMALMKN